MRRILLDSTGLQKLLDRNSLAYYCQDKLGQLDDEIVTEGQAEIIADKSIAKAIKGHGVAYVGLDTDSSGWAEPKPFQPCKVCDNGRKLQSQSSPFALCIACTRASMPLDKLITASLKTLNATVAKTRLFTSLAIQARAHAQRMTRAGVKRPGSGRRGADPGRRFSESLNNRKR